jgi:periplasmic divalent cation tolerance protein
MVRTSKVGVVLATCGNLKEARKIAGALVGQRLAACVNVVSAPVESVYRWKDKVEHAKEFLLVIKTTTKRLKLLESEVARLHSYDAPEFLAIKIYGGSAGYLKWVTDNC